jgi:hypothetical protein
MPRGSIRTSATKSAPWERCHVRMGVGVFTRTGEESNGLAASLRRNPVQFVAVVSPFPSVEMSVCRTPTTKLSPLATFPLVCGSKSGGLLRLLFTG